jgi:hypothetical protein
VRPYSPECVEVEFCEVHMQDPGDKLTLIPDDMGPSPAILALSGWGYTDFHASVNFAFWGFSAPLCQAALWESTCESATRLAKTASEMRLLRHRNASLRDLPSAIFLR